MPLRRTFCLFLVALASAGCAAPSPPAEPTSSPALAQRQVLSEDSVRRAEALLATPVLVPTPRPTNTPLPAGTPRARVEGTRAPFTFDYPPDWKRVPLTSTGEVSARIVEKVGLQAADGAVIMLTIYQTEATIYENELPGLRPQFDAVAQQLADQVQGTVVGPSVFQQVAGRGVVEFRVRFSLNGQEVESRQLNFFVGDRHVALVLEADPPAQTRHAAALEMVLGTFRTT